MMLAFGSMVSQNLSDWLTDWITAGFARIAIRG